MSRYIPRALGTQHPDNASRYVSIQDEVAEAVDMLSPEGIGLDEVMIDFEGKITPVHQPAQVAVELMERAIRPGSDVFITPRLPSASAETPLRQMSALLAVIETNYELGSSERPPIIHEVVIPMAEGLEDLLGVRRRIQQAVDMAREEGYRPTSPADLHIIPLFEDVTQLVTVGDTLRRFLQAEEKMGLTHEVARVFVGRSDPALRYGLIAAVLSNKLAIAQCLEVGEALGIRVAPIWGAGLLPFRGHLAPYNLDNVMHAYGGIATVTVQSGLRYDFSREQCRMLVQRVKTELGNQPPLAFTAEEREEMVRFMAVAAHCYVTSLALLGEIVAHVSDLVPRQRDRLTRKSLAGYGREMTRLDTLAGLVNDEALAGELLNTPVPDGLLLPRVIAFVAAMYSIGIPPEFVGTGRALHAIERRYGGEGLDRLLSKYYLSLKADLTVAHRYLYLENAARFLSRETLDLVEEDVRIVEEMFELSDLEAARPDPDYMVLMETAAPMLRQLAGIGPPISGSRERQKRLVQECIREMGAIRGSLG